MKPATERPLWSLSHSQQTARELLGLPCMFYPRVFIVRYVYAYLPYVERISNNQACTRTYMFDNQLINVQVHDPRITRGI